MQPAAALITLLVIVVKTIFSSAVDQKDFPGLENAKRFREAAAALTAPKVVKVFSNTRLNVSTSDPSTKCSKQLAMLWDGVENSHSWALQMIDASSKIPSGLLLGNRMDLGMYDECVAVDVVQDGQAIRGRHCMYNVVVNERRIELTETLSICVPSSCQPDDVRNVLNSSFRMFADPAGMKVSVTEVTCSGVDPPEWTFGGIATFVGITVLLVFLIICTICDIVSMYLTNKFGRGNGIGAIRQFSFYANARRILNTKPPPQTLPAIQGIRFFSVCCIILGHAYFINIFAPVINLTDMVQWTYSWQSLYILVGPFSVDTFFTISGFLMSYLFLKDMSNGRSFDIIAYYSHRYLRLTPAFAALLLITIFILPRMGSGALWENMSTAEEDICRKSWGSMMLYVHNYINPGCLPHTWYLAAEMHYFWISPIILYPLAKKPKIGLVILAVCLVASILTPTIISYSNDYKSVPFMNDNVMVTARTMVYFYLESHIRAGPWLIGVIFGYLVFTSKGPSRKTTKWIGWILCIAAFAFCIIGPRKFQRKNYVYDEVWETFYTAVARPFWAAAVAWIIYASVRGFGGPLATFLSLPIFHPLGRLSYCMYLVHYVIQFTKLKATRSARFFTYFGPMEDFLSDLILTIVIGFIFSLVFESPILVLENLLIKRDTRLTDEKELKNENVKNGVDKAELALH